MDWIKIKEQLPDINKVVICFSSEHYHPFVCEYKGNNSFEPLHEHLDAETSYDYSGADIIKSFWNEKITHWQYVDKPK